MHPARAQLEAELTPALEAAGFDVLAHAEDINPVKLTAMYRLDTMRNTRADNGPRGRGVVFAVIVTLPDTGDPDALDNACELALDVIDGTASVDWETAERVTFGDQYLPEFEITATVYRQATG